MASPAFFIDLPFSSCRRRISKHLLPHFHDAFISSLSVSGIFHTIVVGHTAAGSRFLRRDISSCVTLASRDHARASHFPEEQRLYFITPDGRALHE